MNDPHVKAIHYFIKHDDSVSYQDVSPLVYEDELFRVKADKDAVVSSRRITTRPRRRLGTQSKSLFADGTLRRPFVPALPDSNSSIRESTSLTATQTATHRRRPVQSSILEEGRCRPE